MTLLIMVDVIVSRNSLVQIIYTSKNRVDIHIPKNEHIHVQINIYTCIICSPSPHIHQLWLFLKRNGSKHKNGTASFSGHDPRTDLSLIYSKGNHSWHSTEAFPRNLIVLSIWEQELQDLWTEQNFLPDLFFHAPVNQDPSQFCTVSMSWPLIRHHNKLNGQKCCSLSLTCTNASKTCNI